MAHLIVVGGPSASGKTTLAKRIKKRLRNACIVSQDDYYIGHIPSVYKKLPRLRPPKNLGLPEYVNMELPDVYNFKRMATDLSCLLQGTEVIDAPHYEKDLTGSGIGKTTERVLKPKKYIIAEGFLLLGHEKILSMTDLSFFLRVPDELQIERRLLRDGKHWEWYCRNVVIPEYRRLFEPIYLNSDVILDATKSLDILEKEMMDHIDEKFRK